MPHLTLEYSANVESLDVQRCLLELNRALAATGQFVEVDTKSRALRFDEHAVGIVAEPRGFIHVKLSLLSGRTVDVKRQLSSTLLDTLRQVCGNENRLHLQLCVQILEIERDTYAKATLDPRAPARSG